MRHAAKRDASEPAIVEALENLGCHVIKFNDKDVCDLGVLYRGTITLMEVKTGNAKLRPGQQEFLEWAAKQGVKVHVVTTPREALDAINFTWGKQ